MCDFCATTTRLHCGLAAMLDQRCVVGRDGLAIGLQRALEDVQGVSHLRAVEFQPCVLLQVMYPKVNGHVRPADYLLRFDLSGMVEPGLLWKWHDGQIFCALHDQSGHADSPPFVRGRRQRMKTAMRKPS